MASSKVKKVAAAEIRAAKKYLERKGFKSSEIPPRKFAQAAKELDKSFNETLEILASEIAGGQG
jgi:hypothetical protein